jgi:hypothetical protein
MFGDGTRLLKMMLIALHMLKWLMKYEIANEWLKWSLINHWLLFPIVEQLLQLDNVQDLCWLLVL